MPVRYAGKACNAQARASGAIDGEINMPKFADYLKELQERERFRPIELIREWTRQEVETAENAFREAIEKSGAIGSPIPDFVGTNQAKGNKAEAYFVAAVSPCLPVTNRILVADGAGYPDRIFQSGGVGSFLEMKATSTWDDSDTIRRVLTSKPHKMIALVKSGTVDAPPVHMICTLIYNDQNSTITRIRLDFLKPESEVTVRFEASTSQSLLGMGLHHSVVIP